MPLPSRGHGVWVPAFAGTTSRSAAFVHAPRMPACSTCPSSRTSATDQGIKRRDGRLRYPRSAIRYAPGDLLGHPRGLAFLFATEMWERFSYYGMRALLVLYMVKYLLLPEHAETVIGLARAQARARMPCSGRSTCSRFASQIYGLYTGLVYLTPIIGGIIADRLLGQRRTVIIGAALMAIGHFMMAFEPLFLFALTSLILGNGAFKPNMSSAGRRALPARRPAPRPRLFDLLCRHQSRRVPGAAGLRHAGRGRRLALRLRRRRRRHD